MIYKIGEFRKSIRTALNLVDSNEVVEITRYGKIYRLVDMEMDIDEKDVVVLNADTIKYREQYAPKDTPFGFCPNGHAIADGKDRCFGKKCKYA